MRRYFDFNTDAMENGTGRILAVYYSGKQLDPTFELKFILPKPAHDGYMGQDDYVNHWFCPVKGCGHHIRNSVNEKVAFSGLADYGAHYMKEHFDSSKLLRRIATQI